MLLENNTLESELEDKMDWDEEQQTQFDALRLRELQGQLTEEEQKELAELVAFLEQEEARYLGPAIGRMALDQAAMLERLQELQSENEELAKLLHQQEQLAQDARSWLADSVMLF